MRLQGIDFGTMYLSSGYPLVGDSCQNNWDSLIYTNVIQKSYDNISKWGFNFVRLGIGWVNLEPIAPTVASNGTVTHNWNMVYVRALDGIIANLTSRGIAVIPDMHQVYMSPAFKSPYTGQFCEGYGMPTWLYPDAAQLEQKLGQSVIGYAFCAFLGNIAEPSVPVKPLDGFAAAWKFVAQRYASNNLVIGADIVNEIYFAPFKMCPQYTGVNGDYSLRNFYTNIGGALTLVNPNLLLMDEGGPAEEGKTNLKGPLPNNSVYAFHFYPDTMNSTSTSLFNYQISYASSLNVPGWMGEFNFKYPFSGTSIDPAWQQDTTTLLALARTDGISESFWAFDDAKGINWLNYDSNGNPILTTDMAALGLLQGGISMGHYSVAFHETGLPGGTQWSVSLGGWSQSSSQTSIVFPALNGTYSYAGQSGGYTASSGSVTVAGADSNLTINFSQVSSTTTTTSSIATGSTTSTTSTTTTTATFTSTTSSSSSTTSSTSSSTSLSTSTTTPSTTSSSSASSSTSQSTTSSISSSSKSPPTSTTTATTSSTAPTTQQPATTGGGGIPEFPYQVAFATFFTALVAVSYLLTRLSPRKSQLRS